jgi:tetratricopeptide (TPR) repeat protein
MKSIEDICIKKGQALVNIDRYSEAEEYYKSIMELCPGEYKLNGELACAKFYQGKYKTSKEHYDRNLEEYSIEKDNKPFKNPLIPENLDSIIEFFNQNNIEHSELINNDFDNTEKRNNILRSIALKITAAVVDNEDNDEEILKWAVDKWVEILNFYMSSKQLESIISEKLPDLSLVDDEDASMPKTGEAVKDEAAVLNKVNSKVYKAYLLTGFYLVLILLMGFSAYRSYKNSQNTENPFSPNYAGNFGESVKYLGIGENLLAQSQYNAAIEAFDKSIELYSDNARVHVGKAAALIGLKEYEKAVDECDTALTMNKDYEEALICKGDTLALLKRYSEAITAYTKAIEINPNNVGAANKIEECKKMINN